MAMVERTRRDFLRLTGGGAAALAIAATFDLGHPLIDLMLGSILEKRTKKMFVGTLENGK